MSIVADILFVLFMALMFFFGYRKGFLTKAWWLLDIGLIVVLGVFLAPTVKGMFSSNLLPALENAFASLADSAGEVLNLNPEELADIVLSVIVWIGLGIIVVIVMAILKHFLRKLNRLKFFGLIDKIFGGVYSLAITLAVLMILGALLGTFVNFGPIEKAAEFCADSYVFKYVFGANPFQNFADKYVPLGTWIGDLVK